MSQITQFVFAGATTVRSLLIDEAPWFVAADVCKVLELNSPRSSLALLDPDEKDVHSVDTPSRNQHEQYSGSQKTTLSIINESGLYSLILRSRKPQAKAFKKWITSEVLPAIRRTGSYSATPPVERISAGRRTQLDNAARGSLPAEFYPPWPLNAKDLRQLTRSQIQELQAACRVVSANFHYEHKAGWAIRSKIENSFGAPIPDLENWQFGDARQFVANIQTKAEAFKEQVALLESRFWEDVTYRSSADLNLALGQVFVR